MVKNPVLGTVPPYLRRGSNHRDIQRPDIYLGTQGYYRVLCCKENRLPYNVCGHNQDKRPHTTYESLYSEWVRA